MNGPKRLSEQGTSDSRVAPPSWPRGWGLSTGKRLLKVLALLALITAEASVLAQDVYTWRDANGRIHYGNRPPENQAAEPVHLNSKPIPIGPADRIYTWTDAQGKVHYGVQPPPDVQAKEVNEDDSPFSTIHAGQLRESEKKLLQEIKKR